MHVYYRKRRTLNNQNNLRRHVPVMGCYTTGTVSWFRLHRTLYSFRSYPIRPNFRQLLIVKCVPIYLCVKMLNMKHNTRNHTSTDSKSMYTDGQKKRQNKDVNICLASVRHTLQPLCNLSATKIHNDRRGVATRYAVGRRLVGDWSATNRGLVADWSATGRRPRGDLFATWCNWSPTGRGPVPD